MTVILGAHLRQQSNLEILLRQSKALAKSENAVVKTYGKDFGHRATTEFPSLHLCHLSPIYINDDPSTSNSYAPPPYITGQGEFIWTSYSPPHALFWVPQPYEPGGPW